MKLGIVLLSALPFGLEKRPLKFAAPERVTFVINEGS